MSGKSVAQSGLAALADLATGKPMTRLHVQDDESLAGLNAYDREQERIKMEKLAELAKMPARALQTEMSSGSLASSGAGTCVRARGLARVGVICSCACARACVHVRARVLGGVWHDLELSLIHI